jgi:hypothetical protein
MGLNRARPVFFRIIGEMNSPCGVIIRVMRGGFLLFASFLANFAFAADPPPEFSAAGVVHGRP